MISVIVCSIDDKRFATMEAHYRAALGSCDHEIIRIGDARSMCEGYNRGVRQSRGEVLIFSHDDVELLCGELPARIEQHLKRFDVLGVAGTMKLVGPRWVDAGVPHVLGQVAQPNPQEPGWVVVIFAAPTPSVGGACAMDGLWLCAKRPVAEKIGFDEQTFAGFDLYDLDFTFRASQAGYKLGVCNDLMAVHASLGDFSKPNWKAAAAAFTRKHGASFASPPIERSSCAWVLCTTKDQIRQAMSPPWWIE